MDLSLKLGAASPPPVCVFFFFFSAAPHPLLSIRSSLCDRRPIRAITAVL